MKIKTIKHKGQALVETALLLPIMLMLIFGIIEFGLILNTNIVVSNASREGARYASLGYTDSEVKTLVNNETSTLTIKETKINYENKGTDDENVEVIVTCSYKLITPIVGNLISESGTFDIKSSTKMRVE
ncbi:TadE/TadG family type IV pilus assembly protein [Clostridium grantii]|uniref:TadE-like protein n=1 Tax=Clostridium grantii DSM 8605 TaxID=1121316 RepID=A0A1M5XB50_9CLOT|nr:TadE family protein [Clostridium grantii]SHH97041.1 TadE-like protein [Clostridium grantii DSM 8605]